MSLRVIGAGFGRTGTNSLKVALERLGFARCHHMKEVFLNRAQVNAWYARSRGEAVDWDRVFEGYQASCDWPSAAYWEELYAHFPGCKVILTVRDEERWYDSVKGTIYPIADSIPRWLMLVNSRVRRLRALIETTIWTGVFDGRFEDREHAIRVYRENSERVRRLVPAERLLVFEARDGWEPLCAFLGVPVPEGPYPHVNDAASMKRFARILGAVRWLPVVLLLAGALVVLLW